MNHSDLPPTVRLEVSSSSILKILAWVLGAYLLFLLRDIILIILTAIVIASAIEPINQWFKRHYVDRIYAVIIIYLTSAIIMFGLIYFFIPSLVEQFSSIAADFPSYIASLEDPSVQPSGTLFDSIRDSVPLDGILGSIQNTTQTFFASPAGIFSAVFGGLLSFVLIVVISFYLAVQEDGVANFLRIITPRAYEGYVINLWSRTRKKIGAWLQGQLILSVIVGTLSFVGLSLLGIPNALLLSIIAAMFELIPLFGPIFASIPAILLGFIAGGVHSGLLVAALYFAIQQLENHIFHPIVVKKVVGVPALLVIIALLIGGQLAGFLGLILAVPLAAGFMELINDIELHKGKTDGAQFAISYMEAEADKKS